MNRRFDRVRDFYGEEGFRRIRNASVLVAGVGGVGSHCALALCRSGAGSITLCDFDVVTETGLNRSALFGPDDPGRKKAEAAAEKLAALCPDTVVSHREVFLHHDTIPGLLRPFSGLVVADAIDSLNPKAELISWCLVNGLTVLSSMGASGRRDPSRIRVGDLWETRGCPLARKLRRYLRNRSALGPVMCVFSTEKGMKPLPPDTGDLTIERGRRRNRLPSLMTMPGMFGYALAQLVLNAVTERDGGNVWESNPPRMV